MPDKKTVKKAVKKTASSNEGPSRKIRRLICDLPLPKISSVVGNLLACGQGDMGQLGLGEDEMEKKRPALVTLMDNVVDLCAGGMHSLCLTKDGELYSFGCNDEGALGRDTTEEGSEFVPKKIELPNKCVKISAGDSHSACLLSDGRVFAWGSFRDSHGNMGLTLEGNKRHPIEVLPKIKCCDIGSGADHLVILTCSGKVYTMGCAEQGQLGRVSLRSASGETRRGKTQLLQPGIVIFKQHKLMDAIWATTYCTFTKELNSSKIYAFGLNNYIQLGYKKKTDLIINPVETQFQDVKTIAGGQHHTLVLTKDNKCYAIGRRDYGRLGLGNVAEDVVELQLIKSLENKKVVDISCGEAQSFAVTKDGKLYAWGMGSNLQLGTGTEDDALEPTLIVSKQTQDKKIIKASSGGQHSLFLVAHENQTQQVAVDDTDVVMDVKEANAENMEPKVNGKDDAMKQETTAAAPKKGRKKK